MSYLSFYSIWMCACYISVKLQIFPLEHPQNAGVRDV